MIDIAPWVRIGLRVVSGIMIGKGWFSEDSAALFLDDEMIGLAIWVLTEVWYLVARRMGWAR